MWEQLEGLIIEDETGEEYEINEVNSVRIDGGKVEGFGRDEFHKVNWEELSAGVSEGERSLILRGRSNVIKNERVSLRNYQEVTITFS